MKITVCIKQVPDVDDIKWTKENNLDRSLMLSKINKYDDWALNHALRIKSKFKDAYLTVISMGPNQAKDILYQALAKGADKAILLSDKMFMASDTLATSKIISSAIKKYTPDFNIILTGQVAQDGDTAQVPISIAQMLNIIDVTNCIEIINADKHGALLKQKIDNITNIIEIKTPCLIAVKAPNEENYMPRINDYIWAQNTGVEVYGFDDLELDKTEVGIMGSPTYVNKAFRPEINKDTKEIKENYSKILIDLIEKAKNNE